MDHHQQILHPLCNRDRGSGSAETLRPFDLTARSSRVVANQYSNTVRLSHKVTRHAKNPVLMLFLNLYQTDTPIRLRQ